MMVAMIVILVALRLGLLFLDGLFGLWVDVVNRSLCPVAVVTARDQEAEDSDADEVLHDGAFERLRTSLSRPRRSVHHPRTDKPHR